MNIVCAYDVFIKMLGLTWKRLRYKAIQKLPFIPLETELDQLISSASKKLATFQQLLKETAMRSEEAWKLKWIDIDTKHSTIRLNEPEKYSNPRMFKISNKLMTMFNQLPKKNSFIFGHGNLKGFGQFIQELKEKTCTQTSKPKTTSN